MIERIIKHPLFITCIKLGGGSEDVVVVVYKQRIADLHTSF